MQGTLTSKGQITIPKQVRDLLHLKNGDRVEFILDEAGDCRMVPVTASVKRLKGMLPKPKKPVSLSAMEKAIAQGASR